MDKKRLDMVDCPNCTGKMPKGNKVCSYNCYKKDYPDDKIKDMHPQNDEE